MEQEFDHHHDETLITGLEILMNDNIIRFGDLYRKQILGTAMGKPPAPMWANVFESLHELEFLPRWTDSILFYVRFIADVYGIWMPPTNCTDDENNAGWTAFIADANDNDGLE